MYPILAAQLAQYTQMGFGAHQQMTRATEAMYQDLSSVRANADPAALAQRGLRNQLDLITSQIKFAALNALRESKQKELAEEFKRQERMNRSWYA